MKLDSRIIEGKRPLTCIDIEQAREFEGKPCLFSDNFRNYKDIKELSQNPQFIGELTIRADLDNYEYPFINQQYDGTCYGLVLPLEWVKPEEPKKTYRAFSFNEFTSEYDFGDVITYRFKEQDAIEEGMFVGGKYLDEDAELPGCGYVVLGNCRYSLTELFNNYEIMIDDKWQPFGIEVEE